MCRLLFLRMVMVSIALSLITACGDGAGPTAASTSTMSAGGSGGNGDGPTDSSAGRDGSSRKPNMACAKDDDCDDGQICEQDDPQAPGKCIDAPNGGASAMMMINNPEGGTPSMGDEAKPCVNDRVCEDDEYCAKPDDSARGTCQPKEDMGGAPEGGDTATGGDMGSGGMNQSGRGGQSAMGGNTPPMAGDQAGMGGMNGNMMAGGGNMMNMQGGQPAAGGQGQQPVVEFDTDRRGLVEFTESFEEGSMTETVSQRVRFRFWSQLPPAADRPVGEAWPDKSRVPVRTSGSCRLFDSNVMRNDGVVLNVGEGGFVNAGLVSVDAGQGLMYSLSNPADDGTYAYVGDTPLDLWRGDGHDITITGEGRAQYMGEFTSTLASPENLQDVAVGMNGMLSRNGVAVTWQAGNGDRVVARLKKSNSSLSIECSSNDDGQLNITAEAIAWLGADAMRARVTVARVMRRELATVEPQVALSIVLRSVWTPRLDNGLMTFVD